MDSWNVGLMEILNVTQDISQVEELINEQYPELKKKLRIKNEFCIYLEDDQGNVIYISEDRASIGSNKIVISDTPCEEE